MAVKPSDLLQVLDLYEEAILERYPEKQDPRTLRSIDKLRRMAFGTHGYAEECHIPLPPTDPVVTNLLSDVPDLSAHQRAALLTLIGRRWDWWCEAVGGKDTAIVISSALRWLRTFDPFDMGDSGEMLAILDPEPRDKLQRRQ